jgi:uncharacterized protein
MRTYAVVLGLLAVLFSARVAGQAAVALWNPSFLPPMEQWDSGLLPYPLLLAFQIGILIFQADLSRQLWKGMGRLCSLRPVLGNRLKWFSGSYFLVMAARYAISMSVYPERRWFGNTIPIWFHFVLAFYLYLLSRHWRGLAIQGKSPPNNQTEVTPSVRIN